MKRIEEDWINRQALDWFPINRDKKPGRPKQKWIQALKNDFELIDLSSDEMEKITGERASDHCGDWWNWVAQMYRCQVKDY